MMSARRPRIYPYLHPELRERLAKYCAVTNTTESAVVAEALDKFLLGETDHALFLRRLDRLSLGQDRILWGLEVLSQALALLFRMWFAHTPRIPRDARSQARASADVRYRKLMDRLSAQLAGGKRFLDDLPQERIADDDELGAIRHRASDELADGTSAGSSFPGDGDDDPSPHLEPDFEPETP
jgi:hypothetical protein